MSEQNISELRTLVMRADGVPATIQRSAELWFGLVRGELEVAGRFMTSDREYLVLGERPDRQTPLCGRKLDILQSVLVGVSRKVVSFDFEISPSTVALALSAALRDLGLDCSPGRIPPLLVVLARAARGDRVRSVVTIADIEHGGLRYHVVARDVDSPLFEVLAPAQRAVLRQLIQGSTYADIAARRRTSSRTVANQVAAACRRLGVSGRFDLVQFVVSDDVVTDGAHPWQAPRSAMSPAADSVPSDRGAGVGAQG